MISIAPFRLPDAISCRVHSCRQQKPSGADCHRKGVHQRILGGSQTFQEGCQRTRLRGSAVRNMAPNGSAEWSKCRLTTSDGLGLGHMLWLQSRLGRCISGLYSSCLGGRLCFSSREIPWTQRRARRCSVEVGDT